MLLKLFITLILTSLIINGCDCKKEGCSDEKFLFEVSVKASPDRDSILINDTIWLEINESVNLKDLTTNTFVNFNNAANLGSTIGFEELLGNSQRQDAVIDFSYFLTSGTEISSINPARFKEYLLKEESGRYIFRLGIIPKKIGIFRIGFSDAANVFIKNNGCKKADFKILFKNTNQHLYFNDQNFGIITPIPNAMYCFKVKYISAGLTINPPIYMML